MSVAGGVTDSGRTSATARGVAVLLALEFGRVSAEQVADFFGLSSAGAARATASRMRRNVERDEGLRHRIENVRSVVAHAPITRAS